MAKKVVVKNLVAKELRTPKFRTHTVKSRKVYDRKRKPSFDDHRPKFCKSVILTYF